jgi:hypothetical protein
MKSVAPAAAPIVPTLSNEINLKASRITLAATDIIFKGSVDFSEASLKYMPPQITQGAAPMQRQAPGPGGSMMPTLNPAQQFKMRGGGGNMMLRSGGGQRMPQMPQTETTPGEPAAGAENPRLSGQRSQFFKELDNDPGAKRRFTQAALAEGGQKGLQANFEQMMNYGNARGYNSASQIVNPKRMGGSGFYGPMNSGAALTHNPTAAEMKAAEQALDAVRKGSNKIDYRTDQGTFGDPNFNKEMNDPQFRMKKIDGAWFADHPMFNRKGGKWAELERQKDAQYAKDHPEGATPKQPETLKPGPGGTIRPTTPETDWSKATPKDISTPIPSKSSDTGLRSGDMNRNDSKFGVDETSAYKSLAKPPSGESLAPSTFDERFAPVAPSQPSAVSEPATVSNVWHGHHHRIGVTKHHPEAEGARDGGQGYGPGRSWGDPLCNYCAV